MFTGNMPTQQQQQQMLQQPNDQIPPWVWGNWLDEAAVGNGSGGVPDKVMEEAVATEDLNMLDQDFDWQDWTQSLKGLDMWQGGTTPGAR